MPGKKGVTMRLSTFDIEEREYYEACVIEDGNKYLLLDFFTTKNEAIKAVKTFKRKYKGEKEIDCFVRLHDENGFGIEDYNL